MLESKGGILFIAGIGFFAFAFLSNVAVPMLTFKDLPEQTVEEVVNDRVMYQFDELSQRYPEQFREAFGEPNEEACADALRLEGKSISMKVAGTATANSSVRFRTSRFVMVRFPKRGSTRMSYSDR